ncbi:Uncharacterised protein [Salmonella enterica subsp. enterica serovar Bovismorbificans]|uniref:Uncharacterized protein n=1 Tax=Salmonella enterica subsp. enterica serovar Bovismorbificans TaxID=58097 RepID=A0A655BV10_SALET|nr:Uncharacterised protein [Salmonella enterica subsp. enterica serovar Bovismorbificans]CNU03440.1 Uncharacterised protein [Salmonella enterica subsp. enterica serovar Bovismorbificans]CNU14933.1 Uncharacterised protein [Salmonella enterica subsp. enterica serovar Bovismorbificans]CNU98383.1 Uncharacterised protein [Salmonella enterica subsp. enterica serovar Bovismorbificans]
MALPFFSVTVIEFSLPLKITRVRSGTIALCDTSGAASNTEAISAWRLKWLVLFITGSLYSISLRFTAWLSASGMGGV